MSWHICPRCGKGMVECIDSRWNTKGFVRRRYRCFNRKCHYRFTSIEERIVARRGLAIAPNKTITERVKDDIHRRLGEILFEGRKP
jgi:transcriptional regulator NrdR family protein